MLINETIVCCAVAFTVMVGVVASFSLGEDPGNNFSGKPGGKLLERSAKSAFSEVYRVKKFERNGKDFIYVMKTNRKSNLSSNKNHPTRIPMGISVRN